MYRWILSLLALLGVTGMAAQAQQAPQPNHPNSGRTTISDKTVWSTTADGSTNP